jgi:membrane protease YdiL (CAAX protease family)
LKREAVRQFIKALSPNTEFAIVVLVAFGYIIVFGNLFVLLAPSRDARMTNADLLFLLFYELAIMALLAPFLRARGWSLQRIGLAPGWGDTLIGIGLALVVCVAWFVIWIVIAAAVPQAAETAENLSFVAPGLDPSTIVLVSVINPIFEETLVCGYVVSALKQRGSAWTAINVSIVIRLLYHLYQGPLGLISVLIVGLVLTFWYARHGRLWPLVVAHVAFDFAALIPFLGA